MSVTSSTTTSSPASNGWSPNKRNQWWWSHGWTWRCRWLMCRVYAMAISYNMQNINSNLVSFIQIIWNSHMRYDNDLYKKMKHEAFEHNLSLTFIKKMVLYLKWSYQWLSGRSCTMEPHMISMQNRCDQASCDTSIPLHVWIIKIQGSNSNWCYHNTLRTSSPKKNILSMECDLNILMSFSPIH